MAIAVDATTPAGVVNNAGGSVTTASFTPPASAVLVATITGNQANSTAGLTFTMSNTGGALTWTKVIQEDSSQAGTDNGAAAIYTAQLGSSTARTVTVTESGAGTSVNDLGLKVWVVTGADLSLTGGNNRGASATNNLTTTSFTSASAASLVFAAGSDWNALGNPTSSDLLSLFVGTDTGNLSHIHGYHTIASLGASVTANLDAGGAGAAKWVWVTAEIRPTVVVSNPVPPLISPYGSFH